jgi:hypothetical protein
MWPLNDNCRYYPPPGRVGWVVISQFTRPGFAEQGGPALQNFLKILKMSEWPSESPATAFQARGGSHLLSLSDAAK